MAEGGVEEMANIYQTAIEKMCELCLEEDSFKQATWYCKQCKQGLCDKCRKYHNKVASVKDHEVVRAEDIPPAIPQSTDALSDELRMPRCTKHNLPIELYCDDHSQPVCNSCKLVDHRKCKRFRDLEHVATENTGKTNDVLQHLESINRGLGKTEDAITRESQSMEKLKDNIIRQIKDKMRDIESLGHQKIAEVEQMFKREHESLQKENDSIKQTQLLVSTSLGDIQTAKQTGSGEEIFLATSRVEKDAEKYQDILNDTSHVTHREVDFEVNCKLNCIEAFGMIELKKCKVDVDLQPFGAVYLNTKSSIPIYWIETLPGDRVIALHCDPAQSIHYINLYSRSTGILSQLDLPGDALSADMLNDHQVIVPIPKKHNLLMIDIVNNKLIQKDSIKTEGRPRLILKYSEQSVLLLVKNTDGKVCFQILDLKGHIQTNIPINETLTKQGVMRMSKHRDIIYISEFRNGCYGFNLKGDTLFHYTHPNVTKYVGLAVDHRNYLHIRMEDQEGRHLTKLSPTGQYIQRIVSGCGIPLKYGNSKLYLVKRTAQREMVIDCFFV